MTEGASGIHEAAPVETLFDRLEAEPAERAVLSAVYQREQGQLVVRHASLLVGPPEMAASSWGKWRSDSARSLSNRLEELSKVSPDLLVADSPTEDGTQVVAGRVSMDVAAARQLLVDTITIGALPAVGPLPEAAAPLEAPGAFLRVFPRLWTEVARLMASAVRPARGFLFPRSVDLAALTVKDGWTVEGVQVWDGSWSALGIAMPHRGQFISPPAQGLFVGRLERRAWFDDVKGDGDFNMYELHIGLEPKRVDVADLEVELEEWANGELTNSRRLLLGDLDLGVRAGVTRVLVSLPTLGRGFAHEARLFDRDGALLDRTQRSKLVERIVVEGRVSNGGSTGETSLAVGEKVIPDIDARLQRLDRLEDDYREMLKKGWSDRIITDQAGAVTVVRNNLASVSGELWVMDPYFGSHTTDWIVLQGLSVSVKVLSGQDARPPPMAMANVEVRRWNGGGAPPFHDRFYLWEGRGLSVGTSPSGLGKRDARVDRMRLSETDGWRAQFLSYWSSSDFVPV